jgi:hypothetical protein
MERSGKRVRRRAMTLLGDFHWDDIRVRGGRLWASGGAES